MTGVFWDSLIDNVETRIKTLEKRFLEKHKNKDMSEYCFWMNSDKSIVIDMSQIVGIIKLDRPTTCRGCICEYGIYTSIEKDIAFPITKNEHFSLIEALQETYDYCEMDDEDDDEDEEYDNTDEKSDNKKYEIRW
jgi:hypothetical protein